MTRTPIAAEAGERTSTKLGWPTWRLAWIIAFGAFLGGLDASLANIGLDTIRKDLSAGLELTQWVASAYVLALAVSLPVCAWLGRKVGVGRLWLAALAAFTVASGLCALAPNIEMLIVFRVVQGLAAGLLSPAGQTILGQAVGPGRLGRVMATLGIALTLAPALGPVAGGLMLEVVSWRWLFLVNLPIGALGLVLGFRFVPRGQAAVVPAMDWIGYICLGSGLPLTVYALTAWGSAGTPLTIGVLVPLGLGVLGLGAYGFHSRGRRSSLLDLGLFRNRTYLAAVATAGFSGALMFGCALLYPLYFQLLHGDDTITTGIRMVALGLGTAVALPLCGRLTDRYGGGAVATFGGLGTVLATIPFAFLTVRADPWLVELLLFTLGVAIGFAAVPPGIAAYQTVRIDQLPDATAQVNIVQRLGGALGGALFAVILARGLSAGAETAFHTVFWWQVGAAVAGSVCAWWLWLSTRAA